MTRMGPSTPDTFHASALDALADMLPDQMTREQLDAVSFGVPAALPDAPMEDIGTMHHHAQGLYGRSVTIKAGTYVMGLPHKIEGFAVIVGDLTMWSLAGKTRYRGAHIVVSKPGPRLVYAHADTTFFTVHPNTTGGTDTDAIEASIVERAEQLMSRHIAPEQLQ